MSPYLGAALDVLVVLASLAAASLLLWAITGDSPAALVRGVVDGVHLYARLYDPIAR